MALDSDPGEMPDLQHQLERYYALFVDNPSPPLIPRTFSEGEVNLGEPPPHSVEASSAGSNADFNSMRREVEQMQGEPARDLRGSEWREQNRKFMALKQEDCTPPIAPSRRMQRLSFEAIVQALVPQNPYKVRWAAGATADGEPALTIGIAVADKTDTQGVRNLVRALVGHGLALVPEHTKEGKTVEIAYREARYAADRCHEPASYRFTLKEGLNAKPGTLEALKHALTARKVAWAEKSFLSKSDPDKGKSPSS